MENKEYQEKVNLWLFEYSALLSAFLDSKDVSDKLKSEIQEKLNELHKFLEK